MNTIYHYRPKGIDEFVFATDKLERQIRRYTDGKTTMPLVLHGTYGTGKSLLAELIPRAIDGDEVSVNKINAEDLNNKKEVRAKFSRSANFDRLFSVGGQTMGYTVVEEVNFDPTAKGALRTCLDDMSGRELFIFTTNEVEKLDRALLSRSEVVEVLPAPPDRFFNRAKHIVSSEGVEITDAVLRDLLEAVYDADYDNRSYYKALDEVIDDWHRSSARRRAA
jgi:replication-associated recombination protein RarA